jgi:hypothetical protein
MPPDATARTISYRSMRRPGLSGTRQVSHLLARGATAREPPEARVRDKPPSIVTKPRSYGDGSGTLRVVISASGGVLSAPLVAGGRVTLGRAPDCDIVIDDESVSRTHACIAATPTAIVVEDIGSTNGTLIGDRCLRRGDSAEVAIGAPFAIGATTVYVLHAESTPPPLPRVPQPEQVVCDPALARVYALLDVFAPSPLSILVSGETGVGKRVFAVAIHERSSRANHPLQELDGKTATEAALEHQLAADAGTMLIAEVGALAPAAQATLVRLLDSTNVRIVATTTTDLTKQIDEDRFRADLYFQLAAISVVIPPLRERVADIEPLAHAFAARFAARIGRSAPKPSRAAIDVLIRQRWKGNLDELRGVVERAVVMAGDGPMLEPEHLGLEAEPTRPLEATLDGVERERILRALDEAVGNQTRAAKLLGISRHALIDRLDRHGIARPRKRR